MAGGARTLGSAVAKRATRHARSTMGPRYLRPDKVVVMVCGRPAYAGTGLPMVDVRGCCVGPPLAASATLPAPRSMGLAVLGMLALPGLCEGTPWLCTGTACASPWFCTGDLGRKAAPGPAAAEPPAEDTAEGAPRETRCVCGGERKDAWTKDDMPLKRAPELAAATLGRDAVSLRTPAKCESRRGDREDALLAEPTTPELE